MIQNVTYKMGFDSSKIIVDSLKVDDVNAGLIIKTNFEEFENKDMDRLQNTGKLVFSVETNSIGSLKNIIDDFFVNLEMAEKIQEINTSNKLNKLNKISEKK
ncbi:hypothetical protein J3E07_000368 [Methanococcus voltae]|uniref:Uncharacterized protein n=2 Tax=Methanococcus voltae TaxID=2188 RepID=A0A8J7S3S0_METVO|nr:KEOPS complex subunit Pcc1 [Methanococcus voltae]MBP2200970.1 hypothetical protein [Methanococcus voltae]MCS3921694.1 hypothetical protein [Methanococcus voltae PS]